MRDNGAGFDPRYRDKLFGVFQRLHRRRRIRGHRRGLALVQRIVDAPRRPRLGRGQPGDGATFYFTLPKEQSAWKQFEQVEILLVEDNPLDAELTMRGLKDSGSRTTSRG